MEKKKMVHLEALRIIAIYFVIFNHTKNNGFFLFSVTTNPVLREIYLFMSIACKLAVPLFYMISGALLLGKEESLGKVYKKRVLRMVITLIAMSLFYRIYFNLKNGLAFDFMYFLEQLYGSQTYYTLWYLYSYIALLMMLPLLRKMACNIEMREYIYLAGMSLLFVGVIPILEYRLSQDEVTMNSYLQGALFTTVSIVFFLMGYFFEHVLPEKYYTLKNACIGLILSVVCIVICCYMTNYRINVTGVCIESESQTFHNSLIAIPTYTMFFCVKLFFMKKSVPAKVKKMICFVGGTTFGIYLLEGMLREETKTVCSVLAPIITPMPACLIWIVVIILIGMIITLILKRIPIIKKLI